MAETRRKFDAEFREGAVRLLGDTGKPITQVAQDLGNQDVTADSAARGKGHPRRPPHSVE